MFGRMVGVCAGGLLLLAAVGCGGGGSEKPFNIVMADGGTQNQFKPVKLTALASDMAAAINGKGNPSALPVAVLSNVSAGFWTVVSIGEGRAAAETAMPKTFQAPKLGNEVADQAAIIGSLTKDKYKGISISAASGSDETLKTAIDTAITNGVAVITVDSDIPVSNRRYYLGTDNFSAGKDLGTLLATAMSGSGSAVILGGFANADNAQARSLGVQAGLAAGGVTGFIYPTQIDPATGRDNSAEQIAKGFSDHPEATGIATVYGYEATATETYIRSNNLVGTIKAAVFDTSANVLQAVHDGVFQGVLGQRPYWMGYLSVYLLAALNVLGPDMTTATLTAQGALGGTHGDFIDTGHDLITADKLDEYQSYLAGLGIVLD